MVNDLRELLRETAGHAPADSFVPADVVTAGRTRVRRRRVVGGLAATVAVGVVVTGAAALGPGLLGDRAAPAGRPDLVGRVDHLSDAVPAGRDDVRVVARHTEVNLNRANGAVWQGVTEDGLVLVVDGPHGVRNRIGLSLLDPTSGEEEILPGPPGSDWSGVLELGADRFVVLATGMLTADTLSAYVLDRDTANWTEVPWPGLPDRDWRGAALGPDGRVYVGVAMTPDEQREADLQAARDAAGDEEVDDAGVTGERYRLWSASLTDPADVRDEGLAVGSFAFDEDTMAWTARTNGTNDRVFVRDLASDEVTSFDPRSGRRCNLLGFGLAGEHVVMSQYCGESGDGLRDDRVQVVTTDGEPVVTVQDSGVEGSALDDHRVRVDALSRDPATEGSYVYDLETGRLLRLSDSVSSFGYVGTGPLPAGYVLWDEAVNDRRGAEQVLARLP